MSSFCRWIRSLAPLLLVQACGPGAEEERGGPAQVFETIAELPAEYRTDEVVLPRRTLARGDSLYRRLAGGANCIVCHGPYLSGGSHGTNLRDGRWHHVDGTYRSLVQVIVQGVPRATHSPIPAMPPRGGIALSDADVEALAAYVYWFARTQPASPEAPHPAQEGEEHEHLHEPEAALQDTLSAPLPGAPPAGVRDERTEDREE